MRLIAFRLPLSTRLLPALCLAIAAIVSPALAQSQPGDVPITFVSNTSWPAFEMNPDGSAGAPLGLAQCVCSCGDNCVAGAMNFNSVSCWHASIPSANGACWIWRPGITGSIGIADNVGVIFRRSVFIPGQPTSGSIDVAVDDFAEVWVNGVLAGRAGVADFAQSIPKTLSLTQYLRSGDNVLELRALNGPASFTGGRCDPCTYFGNPAGLLFGGSISFISTTPVAPGTWGRIKTHYR